MSATKVWAPDFRSSQYPAYPSAGARIGPAWLSAWTQMADGRIVDRKEMARAMAEAHGLALRTMENLLIDATKSGLLLVHTKPGRNRPPKLIRADIYYRSHPDERPDDWAPPAPPREA